MHDDQVYGILPQSTTNAVIFLEPRRKERDWGDVNFGAVPDGVVTARGHRSEAGLELGVIGVGENVQVQCRYSASTVQVWRRLWPSSYCRLRRAACKSA